jgi:predicted enzyme related to lactoylglutathione lyase
MGRMMPGQAPVNYIAADRVDDYVRKAERLEAKVVVPKMPVPRMGWFAQLRDTEGNTFAIWEQDPAAASA